MARIYDNSFPKTVSFDETISIYKHVTVFLKLKNKEHRILFETFRKRKTNIMELLFIQVLYTAFTIVAKWCAYLYFPSSLTIANIAFGGFCPVLLGWILIGVHCIHNLFPVAIANKYFHIEWIPNLQSLWLIMTCFSYALSIVVICNGRPCDKTHQGWFETWGCTFSDKPNDGMPLDMMLGAMIMPLMLSIVEPGALWEYVCLAYIMVIGMILYCIIAYENTTCIGSFAMQVPFFCLFMYENQRQRLIVFLSALSQEALIAENKVLADRAHEVEMRNMIGNVAHDLRTPLSGFVSGLELLQSVAHELQSEAGFCTPDAVVRGPSTELATCCYMSRITTHTATIQKTVQSMRDTNTFMLMTINRCVDYTKCINGLLLVPRMQCVRLSDVIRAAMDCVQNMQSRIGVEFGFESKSLCAEYAVTDSEWLQENLLCLLSNAVKYSTDGTVTLQIQLVEEGAVERPDHLLSFPSSPQTMRASSVSDRNSSRNESFFGRSLTRFSDKYLVGREGEETDLEVGLCASDDQRHQIASAPKVAPCMEMAKEPVGQQSQLLRFEVEDHGMGVSDSVQRMLFSPFKQAQRRGGGTGLGLYTLARRIEALGGGYGVQKRRDGQQGALFWFTIPYIPQSEMSSSVSIASRRRSSVKSLPSLPTAVTTVASVPSIPLTTDRHHSKTQEMNQDEVKPLVLTPVTHHPAVPEPTTERLHSKEDMVSPCPVVTTANSPSLPPTPLGTRELKQDSHQVPTTALIAAEKLPPRESAVSVVLTTPPPKLRILLVDDSITILKMCGAILKRAGHTVVTAENGAEALVKLGFPSDSTVQHIADTEPAFDVVLMDLQMPVMDGVEATQRIRLHESPSQYGTDVTKPKRQVVLGVSACSDDATIDAAFDAGIDGFIPKPLTLDALRKAYECIYADNV